MRSRPCACGCGQLVEIVGRRRWASDACRQRGHRQRQVVARRSAREAVAARGALEDLLQRAAQRARERPGAVVLRLDGRLHALDAGELAELLARARAPEPRARAPKLDATTQAAAPEPVVDRRALEQLAAAVADLSAWPGLSAGVRLVPDDVIDALRARCDALLAGNRCRPPPT